MESIDYWRFHDELTVIEATLLILNIEPTAEMQKQVLSEDSDFKHEGFYAVLCGLKKSVLSRRLKSNTAFYPICADEIEFGGYHEEINWDETTIVVDDLKAWLLSRNFKPDFFFSERASEPDYMNPEHPRYSAKLAAAVNVWLAMEDSNLLAGKSVKVAMESWLENRYLELGLIHEGKINKTGINECFKVANWNDKGGATKTP